MDTKSKLPYLRPHTPRIRYLNPPDWSYILPHHQRIITLITPCRLALKGYAHSALWYTAFATLSPLRYDYTTDI